jgi:hypothetical protein
MVQNTGVCSIPLLPAVTTHLSIARSPYAATSQVARMFVDFARSYGDAAP